MRRSHRQAMLAATLLLVTACGSTVQGSAQLGSARDQGLTAPVDSGLAPTGSTTQPPAVPGGPIGDTGSPGFGPGTAPGGVGTGPGPGQGGAPGPAGVVGPGITATTVYVGAGYSVDSGAGNAALGAAGADPGDQRDYYNAVIADLNKRGGVLGRKMAPVYSEFQAASAQTVDQQRQVACEKWTVDNKVFAIFSLGDIHLECARKAGALITVGGAATGPVYERYPNLIDPSGMRLERLGAFTVHGMHRQGWHRPSPEWPTGRIGLITWDAADYRYGITHGYLPAMRSHGLKETLPVRYVAVPQTANSISDASAAVASAVLAFSNADIDHVFILDGPAGIFSGTGLTFLFMQNSKSQGYYPRYGLNTFNSPGNTDILPVDQQHGMLAIDFDDDNPEADAGIKLNPQRERCFKIMRLEGLDVSTSSTQNTATGICDSVWFVETVLRRAAAPTLAGAIRAAEGLGTSYRPPSTYGSRLGPGRHDGAYLIRASRFDDVCVCMKYVSKPYAP